MPRITGFVLSHGDRYEDGATRILAVVATLEDVRTIAHEIATKEIDDGIADLDVRTGADYFGANIRFTVTPVS